MHKAMMYYPGHPDYVPPPPPTFQQQWRIDNGQNPGNLNFIQGVDDVDENGNPYPEGYTGTQLTANQPQAQSFNPQNQDVLDRAAAALEAIRQDRTNPMYGGQQSYAAPGANGQPIGGTSPIPGLVGRGLGAMSDGLNFAQDGMESYQRGRNALPPVPPGQQAGFAAPGLNTQIQGSPGLRGFINSVGQGISSMYNTVAGALNPPVDYYNGPMENVRPERIRDLQDTPGFRFSWNGAGSGDVPNFADVLNAQDAQPANPIRSKYAPEDRGPIPRSVASQAPSYYEQQGAGMDVESTRMRELAGQIDGLRRQSQQDNPMRPIPGGDPRIAALRAEIDRGNRQEDIMSEPGATSSGGATKNFRKIQPEDLNGITAPTVAGYNGNVGYVADPNRASAERNIASSRANAQRLAEGGAAADPTNGRGRFGGAYGAGLDADATALAEGRAVRTADGKVVYFTGTQESARQAQAAGKTEREALRNRDNQNVPEAELKRRAAADAQAAARAAKHQAFKDANGGMNYRQYDRMTGSSNGNNSLTLKAVREGRLSPQEANYRMQLRAEKALRRSGNPIAGGTSMAGQLYPDMMPKQAAQNQAGRNPMLAVSEKFMPGGIVTPDSRKASRDTLDVLANGGKAPDGTEVPPSPMFAGLADSPDNVQGMHFGIQQMVQDGQDLGVEDLQKLYTAAAAMQAGYGTPDYDPFDMSPGFEAEGLLGPFGLEMKGLFGATGVDAAHTETFGPMYKELATMKDPSPQDLQKWWAKFKSRIRPDTNRFIGGSSILSGEGGPTVSPGGYEYPSPANPMK
jgi:hypothetical protein